VAVHDGRSVVGGVAADNGIWRAAVVLDIAAHGSDQPQTSEGKMSNDKTADAFDRGYEDVKRKTTPVFEAVLAFLKERHWNAARKEWGDEKVEALVQQIEGVIEEWPY
jgi:hypothetical protein